MIPFLSRESSVGISGAVMISTGADGLSRSIGGKLSLVSNWLLVSLGLINILLVSCSFERVREQMLVLESSRVDS